jgi:hypothetical protein
MQTRTILLMSALAITVIASVVKSRSTSNQSEVVESVSPRKSDILAPATASEQPGTKVGTTAADVAVGASVGRRLVSSSASVSIFEARQWGTAEKPAPVAVAKPALPQPAPRTIAPVIVDSTPAAAAVPAPEVVPTPSFKFIGMMQDLRAGKPSVFLAVGERLIVATVGQVVEGGFRLESISPNELLFVHQETNKSTRVALMGERS